MPAKPWVWGVPLLLALAGCASYYEAGGDAPSAELMLNSNLPDDPFRDSESGEPATNQNTFFAFGDAGCTQELGYLAAFANLDDGRKTVRVEAGKRLYILARWSNQGRIDATQVAQRSCHNLVSFVPEAGESYDLSQDILTQPGAFGARAQCRTVVYTAGVYGPTKSFQDHGFRGKCAERIKGG